MGTRLHSNHLFVPDSASPSYEEDPLALSSSRVGVWEFAWCWGKVSGEGPGFEVAWWLVAFYKGNVLLALPISTALTRAPQ